MKNLLIVIVMLAASFGTLTLEGASTMPEAAAQAKKKVTLEGVKSKVIETNKVYDRHSYILTIKNEEDFPVIVDARILWVDSDDFIIYEDNRYGIRVNANSSFDYLGTELITHPSALNVKDIKVTLSIR